MVVRLQKTESGLMIQLPDDTLEILGLNAETEVSITLNPDQQQIIIAPTDQHPLDINEAFAQQVTDFIEQYRPALTALAK